MYQIMKEKIEVTSTNTSPSMRHSHAVLRETDSSCDSLSTISSLNDSVCLKGQENRFR